jgi:chemosensory pili system protein ChpA (sensor histidine kinase/response regulator)
MANVERGVAVAGALNRMIRRVYDYKVGLQQPGISALQTAAKAIATIVSDINQPDVERADYSELISHLTALADAVEVPTVVEEGLQSIIVEALAEEEPAAEADYDAEIAAIFSEEAAELLEAADQALSGWNKDKTAREPVEELKRLLHTLKGGARMSGITAMGDLSHELEALVIALDDGRVLANERLDELLQESIDELHRMRDIVITGKHVAAVPDLERRIHSVTSGEKATIVQAAEPAELPLVEDKDLDHRESVSVEFTIEPEDTVSMVIVDTPQDDGVADISRARKEKDKIDVLAHEVEEVVRKPGIAEQPAMTPSAPELPTPPAIPSAPEPAIPSSPESPVSPLSPSAPEQPLPPVTPSPAEPPSLPVTPSAPEPPVTPLTPEPPAPPIAPSAPEPPPPAKPDTPVTPLAPVAEPQPRAAPAAAESRQEFARIDAELLEDLLNAAGEISIYHSRLGQQISSIEFHLEELDQTVSRLRDQLRKLEIETEAQIMHGQQDTHVARDFDPLELDRYSKIQQLSRALAESANDMGSLRDLLQSVTSEAETLLVQQSRVTAELQDGLMRTRMVPFQRHVGRLTRLVRQAAGEAGKRAELAVEGASGELDRQVLDKMLPPFEHMMRNAVVHGIEKPAERQAAGKPATGRITIRLHREGAEMVLDVADDGQGLDVDAIRRKAFERDLLKPDSKLSDDEIMQLILTPGFSTADAITQTAGRGVGMDVVANEIKQLGGSLQISSVTGQGTNFTIRLPFTLAITQALIVRTGDEVYALPLPTVEGVARIARAELETILSQSEPTYEYGEQTCDTGTCR